MTNRGLLIAFEGGEGCGKSTQVITAYQYLMSAGVGASVTKQPGGTAAGRMIRSLLLDPNIPLCPEAETLLFMADRANHVHRTIKKSLDAGNIVLCDRYHLSTLAYQCAAKGIPEEFVTQVFMHFCNGLTPDITIWIDTDVEVALERARSKTGKGGDRMEREDLRFHQKIYNFFANIEQDDNYIRVDGNQSLEKVNYEVTKVIQKVFTLWAPPSNRKYHSGQP